MEAVKPVDVVMPTWNKLDLTRRAIESYRRHVRHPYRLICIDNGSTDGTLEYVRSAADLVIANSTNVGAVRARNLGWVASSAPFVLFSDNDIEFTCDIVAPLVAAMEREPRLGIVGPLLNEYLLAMGSYPEGVPLAAVTDAVLSAAATELQDMVYVQACAMLVRRAMLEQIGAFDTAFDPYGHEEFDLAQRAAGYGWHVAIALDCYAHHHGTGARALPEREALVERNRQTFLRRWSINVDASTEGVVKPYRLPAEDSAAPPARLGDHVKLVERAIAECRLGPDWAADTERFLAAMPVRGRDVLVVGCGAGVAVSRLRHRYSLPAIGLSPVVNGDAKYGVRHGYGFALPFGDASFDTVVARHSLEHSPMPLIDLLETRRVLRPGGLAVLSVPAEQALGTPRPAFYAPLVDAQWRYLLSEAGLTLHEVTPEAATERVRYVAEATV